MQTIQSIYQWAADQLKLAGLETPEADARVIISSQFNWKRNEFQLNKNRKVNFLTEMIMKQKIGTRMRKKPIAYILGYQYFYHDQFLVSRHVLIPRADTEHLLYAIEESGKQYKKILDIGTGSGALALSLARIFPEAAITGLDIDIRTAAVNQRRLGIRNVKLIKKDFFRYKSEESFDLIISNPPYLSRNDLKNLGEDARTHEPLKAFFGGEDGLIFYRHIAEFALTNLNPAGLIVLEIDHKWESVRNIFRDKGFLYTEMKRDYNGLERVLIISR